MAGYSGTPLAKKLGIREGHQVALLNAPRGFELKLDGLPDTAAVTRDEIAGHVDVIVLFAVEKAQLATAFPSLAPLVFPAGNLWVAWPKRSSKVNTDLTEDVLRQIGLPLGMVDNKVCAVDDTWSGLRFTWRRELRKMKKPVPITPAG